jgi:hypothetical protein
MEDNLSFFTLKDDLKYLKIEEIQRTSIALMEDDLNLEMKMEDDLIFLENRR